jgi:hypothetical protein
MVNMVSPVTQTIDIAKSEVKRLQDSNTQVPIRKKRKIDWNQLKF